MQTHHPETMDRQASGTRSKRNNAFARWIIVAGAVASIAAFWMTLPGVNG